MLAMNDFQKFCYKAWLVSEIFLELSSFELVLVCDKGIWDSYEFLVLIVLC